MTDRNEIELHPAVGDLIITLRNEIRAHEARYAALRAAVRELTAAEAAHDAALAGSDHDEWAFATRMAPINARVEAARAALDALTREP